MHRSSGSSSNGRGQAGGHAQPAGKTATNASPPPLLVPYKSAPSTAFLKLLNATSKTDKDDHLIISNWISAEVRAIREAWKKMASQESSLDPEIEGFGSGLVEIAEMLSERRYEDLLTHLQQFAIELKQVQLSLNNTAAEQNTGPSQLSLLKIILYSTITATETRQQRFKDMTETTSTNLTMLAASIRIMATLHEEFRETSRELDTMRKRLDLVQAIEKTVQTESSDAELSDTTQRPLGEKQNLKKMLRYQINPFLPQFQQHYDPFRDSDDSNIQRHEYFRNHRLDGTCIWLLRTEEFEKWLFGNSFQILYCWGLPGIGKSTIMSRVIDALEKINHICAYYYLCEGKFQSAEGLVLDLLFQLCDRANVDLAFLTFGEAGKEEESLHPATMATPIYSADSTIANQEPAYGPHDEGIRVPSTESAAPQMDVHQSPEAPDLEWASSSTSSLPGRRRQGLPTLAGDTTTSWERIKTQKGPLEKLLRALKEVCLKIGQDVFIVLDAWDDTKLGATGDFNAVLSELLSIPCRVLVTSRKEPMKDLPFKFSHMSIDNEKNSGDIWQYVHCILDDHAADDPLLKHFSQSKQFAQLTEQIIRKSHGSFNYARLLMREFLRQSSASNADPQALAAMVFRLEQFSGPANIIHTDLLSLDNEMEDTSLLSKTILIWLSISPSPLSVDMLQASLPMICRGLLLGDRISKSEMSNIMRRLEGLVYIDSGNGSLHLSSDLVKHQVTDLWVELSKHTRFNIGVCCINYILSEASLRFVDLKLEESICSMLKEMPFLGHATQSWAFYSRDLLEPVLFPRGNDAHGYQSSVIRVQEDSVISDNRFSHLGQSIIPGRIGDLCQEMLASPQIYASELLSIYLRPDRAVASMSYEEIHPWIKSMSKLQIASRLGLRTFVKGELFEEPSSYKFTDSRGLTPLHEAARGGFEDVVSLLLSKGASSCAMDILNKTPMHYARETGNDEAFIRLFEGFCDEYLNGASDTVFAAVDEAMEHIPHYSACVIGKNCDEQRRRDLAMIRAIKESYPGVCRFLLYKGGADVNCCDEENIPALHLAIGNNDGILAILLDMGADPSIVAENKTRESALHVAARLGDSSAVKKLVACGADALHVDSQGRTVLMAALDARDENEIQGTAQILLRRGVDIDKVDFLGRRALHLAAARGLASLVKMFLAFTEVCDPKDYQGRTPLDYARDANQRTVEDMIIHSLPGVQGRTRLSHNI